MRQTAALRSVALAVGLVALGSLPAAPAHAFSVRVHIHLANRIRADLLENWERTGRPVVRLLGPAETPVLVGIAPEDAEAIRDYPEHWRGGAIGPDNTVFPGLTDPSHAWHFSPFSQCSALLDAARGGAERAYALGCFLHGISDNAAHHLVNFYSGETFTLYPVESADDGELTFSLLNVVRHMTVEGKFEDAVEAADPQVFAPTELRHRIAVDLVERVYLSAGEGDALETTLWRQFSAGLRARKHAYLREGLLASYDPSELLELDGEALEARVDAAVAEAGGEALRLDGAVVDAYVEFLRSGGVIPGVLYGGTEMTPADYILFLPEMIEDFKRFLLVAQREGERVLENAESQIAEGCVCPVLRSKRRLFAHLFAPADAGGPSRFELARLRKVEELDGLLYGYVQSIEAFSNKIVLEGFAHLGPQDIATAFAPLTEALSRVTEFPYDLLFPAWAVDVLDAVQGLRDLLTRVVAAVRDELVRLILDQAEAYLVRLRAELVALREAALRAIDERVLTALAAVRAGIDDAKLRAMGLDLASADELFASFPTSVLYANAYNSAVGVLADRGVVSGSMSHFFSGPVSFDASYQLDYNQLALCESLRGAFYPCGTTVAEMLQPRASECVRLEGGAALVDPPIECHRFSQVSLAAPDEGDGEPCRPRSLDEFLDPRHGHSGSYTLAFPPEHAPSRPECVEPPIVGVNAPEDLPGDRVEGGPRSSAGTGCAVPGAPSRGPTRALWVVALTALAARGRRGRRGR